MESTLSSRCCECCWVELLRSQRPNTKLFTCLRAWRYVTLQRKHRFHTPTPREWQQARFFEVDGATYARGSHGLNHREDEPFELLNNIFALFPISSELLDHQRRPPLYYALEQHWDLEKLSWLVDKSLNTVMEKDADGLGLITHAVVSGCPEELVVRLAVEAASRCIVTIDELLDGQHYENARRFCHRALLGLFAGVPKFPHSRCRERLNMRLKGQENHAHVAAIAVKDIWQHYVDTWGHFGPPLLQRDLPEEFCPVIDSFVEVSLVAKGEPLTYQWFVQVTDEDQQGTPIEGANQSFIFLSQSIQPHNEGIYYCEVVNRRGRVSSTRMRVRVVDDRVPPDPTKNFVVDRALLPLDYALHNLKASAGGEVYHSQTGAALTLLPNFFRCMHRDGKNVSDSHGAEIAIVQRRSDEFKLLLRHGETVVSCIVELLPKTMGVLLRPALLWLSHCIIPDASNIGVVVEVDTKTGRILRDVETVSESKALACVVIDRLGAYVVISRRKMLRHGESSTEQPLERARLFLLRPRNVSTSPSSAILNLFFALVRDLPNCCTEAEALLNAKAKEANKSASKWAIDSFELHIRENFSLNLQVGARGRINFCWPSSAIEPTLIHWEMALADVKPSRDISLHPDESAPAFVEIDISAVVSKTPIQTITRGNLPENKSFAATPSTYFSLFEREWVVTIPVLHDATAVFGAPPPTPAILRRTSNKLVLDLKPPTTSSVQEGVEEVEAFGDKPKEGSVFLPYFYVVELAVFSPTFWQRYDQTWWFDKTKTAVIDGMYKVVHRGYDTKVTVVTSTYGGCIRVARCSVDRFGSYSEPLLLTPLLGSMTDAEGCPGSLSKEIPASSFSWSIQLQETTYRVRQLLETLQINEVALRSIYGMPRSVKTAVDVVAALEETKTSLCSCNFELALLLSGFKALERHLSLIKLARDSYAKLTIHFLRVQRAVPELDCYPVAMAPVIRQLHELLRELFGVVKKLSSPGWMQYFLMDEWFEDTLARLFASTADMLERDGSALRCSKALQAGLRTSAENNISLIMKRPRFYLLMVAGRLRESTDQQTKLMICCELGHVLQFYPSSTSQQQGSEEEDVNSTIAAELLAELESLHTKNALTTLRQQDCLQHHLVRVTPSDGEKCVCVPEAVHLDLDSFVCGVNPTSMHLVIRVSNISMNSCAVQGKNSFCERTGRLSFFPAAEFERKSCYRVTVCEHEILSSLGGTLPERSPYVVNFSTPA